MPDESKRVLIAGGSPVGLLCAWHLSRQGIPVRLFDDNDGLQSDPRAATTHPATLDLLADDGLADDMARVGLIAPIFQFWDRPSNRLAAEFDHSILVKDTRHPFVVQCEQFKTASLLLKRVQKLVNVEVLFNHQVVDVWQASEFVSVDVRGPASMQTHAGAYLIGADGGRSTVRKRSDISPSTASPGRSDLLSSRRHSISRLSEAMRTVAILPSQALGVTALRSPLTGRLAYGERCSRRSQNKTMFHL
jgi:3-(3-hydroxy-phenyl)propionate hydroxylase